MSTEVDMPAKQIHQAPVRSLTAFEIAAVDRILNSAIMGKRDTHTENVLRLTFGHLERTIRRPL